MERLGLVGAMPCGGRWRAQGYIDGSTKYLGTFDTEEEAHQVFLKEKGRAEAAREAEAALEVERILAGPTYVYEGGKGRGATLNGTRFKIIEAQGPHQALAVPLDDAGLPKFAERMKVTLAYLKELPPSSLDQATVAQLAKEAADWERGKLDPKDWDPAPEAVPLARPVTVAHVTSPKATALTVDPAATQSLKDSVRRFVSRSPNQDVQWAAEFARNHGTPEVRRVVEGLAGDGGIERLVQWLGNNTSIAPAVLREVELSIMSGVFMSEDATAAARVLHKGFPDAFPEPDMLFVDADE